MNAEALLDELRGQGIRLDPLPNGNLYVAPKERLTPELIERIRQNKPALVACLSIKQEPASADEALALLQRLKCYTVPSGRVDAAREIVARLGRWKNGKALDEADDPASIVAVLRNIERELIKLGGLLDPELAEVVEIVQRSFPGARLVKIQ
jgi:hypothetical protein